MNEHPTPEPPPKRSAAQFLREQREFYERAQSWLRCCAGEHIEDWGNDTYRLRCLDGGHRIEVVDDFSGYLRVRSQTTFFPSWRFRKHLDGLLTLETE